jgi:hypothetical protein
VVAVVAGTLALAPFASAGVKNACALVTSADVSTALKGKVGTGTHSSVAGFNTCVYTLGKVTVTVKTRLLSRAGYAKVVKSIPGTALKTTDISAYAWVGFITNGYTLYDWKQGNQIGFVVSGAGADAILIIRALAKPARSRV